MAEPEEKLKLVPGVVAAFLSNFKMADNGEFF